MQEQFYQTLHSPPGACAAFALGYLNHGGGFAVEQDRVPEQDVFIGVRKGKIITCLPFFRDAEAASRQSFVSFLDRCACIRAGEWRKVEDLLRFAGQGVYV